MGIHRISRASTSAVRSLTGPTLSSAISHRHSSTTVARTTNHLDDPYERILPPLFPTEEQRETARDKLAQAVGVSSHFLLPPSFHSALPPPDGECVGFVEVLTCTDILFNSFPSLLCRSIDHL